MAELLRTRRLLVRDWSSADAEAVLKLYGHEALRRWVPARTSIPDFPDTTVMQQLLQQWVADQRDMAPGTGRWALVALEGGVLVGGISLLPMPVPEADVEMECQLAPEYWGRGYVTEAAQALAHWAFEHSLVELFALVEPDNARAAATARRIGMEWVGESEKYHGTLKQVFRLRPDDLANAVRSRPG